MKKTHEKLYNALIEYKTLQITKEQLVVSGGNVFNIYTKNRPITTNAGDVIIVLEKYKRNEITSNTLIDWVNFIWFSGFYVYNESEEESIAVVMNELEEGDELPEKISLNSIQKYINVLSKNIVTL